MNKTYNLVWNAIQQAWVVTSELGKARKKVKNIKTVSTIAAFGTAILCSTAVYADPAPRALPSLNNIASGAATLATATGSLTVNQTTDKLIANWNSFDVGVNSKVTFIQPNTSSIALNRISGAAPSEIFGRVTANGQLILVNPAGLTFGAASQVNAASVIASTLDITDANFLADTLQFDRGTATGTINNQGILLANEGNTYVFASNINNSGTIRAKAGNVNIANGNRLTVNSSAGTATLNQVSGIAGVISSTGILRGDRLTTTDKGKIYLIGDRARNGSIVNLSGELTSTGNDIKGKTVNITGDTVVNASTNLNAINSININGALSVSGNNRLISLTHSTTGTDGFSFGGSGKISMPGSSIRYRVNNNYYTLIKTLAELQAIGSNATTLAGQYVLANDIDASSTATTSFNPIGSSSTTGFSGVLDGLGNSINNLTINKPTTDEVGLIGFNQFGSLKNIVLTNAAVTGQNYVGGLIGRNSKESSLTGSSTISGNRISGTIHGERSVGGLIGSHEIYGASTSIVQKNTSNATITSSKYNFNVGGLIGIAKVYNNSVFTLAHNQVLGSINIPALTGDYGPNASIGGLIGLIINQNGSKSIIGNNIVNAHVTTKRASISMAGGIGFIDNSNSSLDMSNNQIHGDVSSPDAITIGGLIGGLSNSASTSTSSPIIITNNLTTGNISGDSYVGGLIGKLQGAGQAILSNNATTGIVSGSKITGGLVGFSQLNHIINNHASGTIYASKYAGGLVGQNYETPISNSYASGDVINAENGDYLGGLVGYNSGTLSTISNSYATGNIETLKNSSLNLYVGGLIGDNYLANILNTYATGRVSGSMVVGGLIGRSSFGNISNSQAYGQVTINDQSAGGLVGGYHAGTINNSYAVGSISSTNTNSELMGGLIGYSENSSINNSYASGSVSGGSNSRYLGGLIGSLVINNGSPIFSNNYSTSTVSGAEYIGGLFGSIKIYTDTMLKINNSYSNRALAANGNYAGGLIGYLYNTHGKLYLSNSYAAGQLTGGINYKGGLIGYAEDSGGNSYLSNSFWDKSMSGVTNAIGYAALNQPINNLTGLTTSETLQQASYTGWDVSNVLNSNSIWYINENISTPVLRSFITH